jgi:hypothetical protein
MTVGSSKQALVVENDIFWIGLPVGFLLFYIFLKSERSQNKD